MDIKLHQKGDYAILQIKGSLDMYSSLELKNLTENLPVGSSTSIILDLSEVNYVDSSGIGTMIKIVNQVQDAGGKLYITGLKPMIEKIFKVAGLMNYFAILSEHDFKSRFPLD